MLNKKDNFEEDKTLSPCGDCKWKGSNKCNRCVNRNRIDPIRYWSPQWYPPEINPPIITSGRTIPIKHFSHQSILTTCNGAICPQDIPNDQD